MIYPRRAMSLAEFTAMEWPQPQLMLTPWLPVGGLSMIYGPPGGRKSWFALAAALSIASGAELIPGMVPNAVRRVLYVDAEMQPGSLKKRFLQFGAASVEAGRHLSVMTHAAWPLGIPDLAEDGSDGRELIEDQIADTAAEAVFLDNKSTLLRSGVENDADSVASFIQWLLGLRRDNRSVVLIHHSRKAQAAGGASEQRGTSKMLDALDTVLALDQGPGTLSTTYIPVALRYPKARHFVADPHEAHAFALRFSDDDRRVWWEAGSAEEPFDGPDWLAQARQLRSEGKSNRAIAQMLGCVSDHTVGKWLGGQKLKDF